MVVKVVVAAEAVKNYLLRGVAESHEGSFPPLVSLLTCKKRRKQPLLGGLGLLPPDLALGSSTGGFRRGDPVTGCQDSTTRLFSTTPKSEKPCTPSWNREPLFSGSMDEDGDDKSLPPNWREARDSDGKAYYFNELTGETSWTFPEGGSGAVTAAPAAIGSQEVMPQVQAEDAMAMGATTTRDSRPSIGSETRRELIEVFGEGLPKLLLLLVASFVLMVQVSCSSVVLGFVVS